MKAHIEARIAREAKAMTRKEIIIKAVAGKLTWQQAADILGITRQTAVFAFTCGDGFSNSVIPTSGVLMAMLALAKIPYTKWLKFIMPLFLMLMGLSAVFLVIAVAINYQ